MLSHVECFLQHFLVASAVAHLSAKHGGISFALGIIHQVGALGIENLCLSFQCLLHRTEDGLVVIETSYNAPCTRHVLGIVCQRTYKGNLTLALQRQQIAFVLEQYESLGSYLA